MKILLERVCLGEDGGMPCLRVFLGFAVLLTLPGCFNPLGFSFLGTAHYAGKRFLGLKGQFEAIAVAPTGDRVAFRGRDAETAFVLFVADVDGIVRKVAATGPSDGLVAWAADGRSLCYLDSVPRPDGMLAGATIQHLDLASGAVTPALYAVSLVPFFPSPDGRQLVVAGPSNLARQTFDNQRHQLIDLPGGSPRPIVREYRPVRDAWAGRWAPDGKRLALAVMQGEYGDAVKVVVAQAPGWHAGAASQHVFRSTFTAMAWEDPTTLRVAEVVGDVTLALTRLGVDGQVIGEATTIPLDSPPAGTCYGYAQPLFSADARRLLLTRMPIDKAIGSGAGPRQHFVLDGSALRSVPAPEDVEAIGWCGNGRVLTLTGFYQDRRPVMLEVAP